jgi:flagellar basal body-associated protein FliL
MAKPAQKTAPKAAASEPATVPAKKGFGKLIAIALLGIIAGGGGAAGYFMFVGPKAEARAAQKLAEAKAAEALLPPETMKIDRMVLPLLTRSGDLHGYVTLEIVLELERDSSEFVKVRVPMIRHGFNAAMATQSVMDASEQGINYDMASRVLTAAANQAIGTQKVQKVNIVTAVPL